VRQTALSSSTSSFTNRSPQSEPTASDMALYSLTVLCALFQAAAVQAAPANASRQLQAFDCTGTTTVANSPFGEYANENPLAYSPFANVNRKISVKFPKITDLKKITYTLELDNGVVSRTDGAFEGSKLIPKPRAPCTIACQADGTEKRRLDGTSPTLDIQWCPDQNKFQVTVNPFTPGRVHYTLSPLMDWKWPTEHNVDCKDYHRRGRGPNTASRYNLANACDSSAAGYFISPRGLGVNGADYIDFIFTFDDATWVSGYRQFGNARNIRKCYGCWWGRCYYCSNTVEVSTFTKDIEIYTGNTNSGPWTRVATGRHSNWHNGATNTFPNDGTTTKWNPTSPSKYLKVRTNTNYGSNYLTVRFLQLKFSARSN